KDYNVLLLSDFLYGGRAIVYGLLAATDPALIRGIKTLVRGREFNPSTKQLTSIASLDSEGAVLHIELSSLQSPPPPNEDTRDPKPTRIFNPTLKQDAGVPAIDTYDLRPDCYPQLPTDFAHPLPSRIDGNRRRRAEREMMEEDSFEKGL
ncbi:hypothetical protein L218DRAFT_622199, partial [Marasmius fiardii PR-910]